MRYVGEICLCVFLCIPYVTHAEVRITEIAWPHTNFALVLIGFFVFFLAHAVRTFGTQNWCVGKPPTPNYSLYIVGIFWIWIKPLVGRHCFVRSLIRELDSRRVIRCGGKMGTVGLFVLFLLPVFAYAEVRITEIAWMGTEQSAHDEWIELSNTGEAAVDLAGWLLTDDENLEIELSGTIAPDEYVVLERTDDSSAPGDAFLIYTGALSNEGRTLFLRRSDGSRADEVPGGDEWNKVGGDNEKKYTAQWTGTRWVTAPPTPGSAAAPVAHEDPPSAPRVNDTENTSERRATAADTPLAHGPEKPPAYNSAEVLSTGEHSNEDRTIFPYLLLAGVIGLGILGVYADRIGSS